MKVKLIILAIFFLFINIAYSQIKNIKVIKVTSIDYYYVYEVIEFDRNCNDTLILLGNKRNNEDYNEILLKKNKKYEVEIRLKSAIRMSEKKYMFCKPTQNILNKVIISNKKSLPILILSYKEILE